MKRATIYIAAGLLLTAAAVKTAFPARTSQVIYSVKETAAGEPSAEQAAQTAVQEPAAPYTVTINAGEFLSGTEYAPKETVLPAAVEQAVETFMESQAPFAELELPADVTYEVEMPSFPYVKPVTAATSSGFGYRVHPLENLTKFHYGTDLAAMSGEDIACFADGTVTEVGETESLGKFIRVSHDDGYATLYAHCGTVYVARDQRVTMGEKIGLVGATGKATGPHLHFELTKDGVYMNPEFYLSAL